MIENDAIGRYCRELASAAELACSDLDEIEDHLRALADDLQANGMPYADALAEACRRLGSSRSLAHEYARVRSPFGARLSRARAWSAAALLAWWWLSFARLTFDGPGPVSIFGVNLVISTVALCGLIARASWARAIILGALSWFVVDQTIQLAWQGIPAGVPLPAYVLAPACKLGAFLFVMPWRRGELARASIVIILLAWTYHGVNQLATYQLTSSSQLPFVAPGLSIAFLGTLLAGLAVLARASWAALPAAAAALGLALGLALDYAALHTQLVRFADPTLAHVQVLGGIAAGALAAAWAAVLSWRGAHAVEHRIA